MCGMALQDAILAALAYDESSGYDLAKAFDITVANYWTATPQQLYRELDKMEAAGLIVARVVEQMRRPNKRLFSLTPEGRETLRAFTARTPKPIAIRDDLLVQVEAMESGETPAVEANIREKLAASEVKLKHYERTREHLLAGQSEADYLATVERVGPYLTLARGILFEEENIQWCEFALAALISRQDPSAQS